MIQIPVFWSDRVIRQGHTEGLQDARILEYLCQNIKEITQTEDLNLPSHPLESEHQWSYLPSSPHWRTSASSEPESNPGAVVDRHLSKWTTSSFHIDKRVGNSFRGCWQYFQANHPTIYVLEIAGRDDIASVDAGPSQMSLSPERGSWRRGIPAFSPRRPSSDQLSSLSGVEYGPVPRKSCRVSFWNGTFKTVWRKQMPVTVENVSWNVLTGMNWS